MSDNESTQSRERGTATKRGRYVSNACEGCQKRKVKCTGENPCQQCQMNDLGCTYSKGKKRRRTRVMQRQSTAENIPQEESCTVPNAVGSEPNWSESLTPMIKRITDLERVYQTLRMQLDISRESDRYLSPQSTGTTSRPSLPANEHEPVIPLDEGFRGPTNLFEPIRLLSRTVAGWEQIQGIAEDGVLPEHCPANNWDWHDPATERTCGIEILDRESRVHDIGRLQHAVDIFFAEINPMFPCLNENQFRRQLQDALETGAAGMSRPDRYQFFALLHLIQAEIDLLSHDWRPTDPIPGWKSILHAEKILSRLLWQGNGNLLTLQCYLVKTRYFLYLERGSAAHETITRAVRLCFQLGLHDSSSWGGCSPFECLMRQRVFWTVFQLERSLALNNGSPYLIRDAEINVDLPACYNERQLFPDQPLPAEGSDHSYGPTVAATAKWGLLDSEIWDGMFAAKGKKSAGPEYIAGLDARIIYILNSLPPGLQNPGPVLSPGTPFEDSRAPFFARHSAIMHLRFHQLRLLLHQKTLLSFDYEENVALICLSVIKKTLRIIQSCLNPPNRVSFRFIAVFHIVVTLIPLVCLIVHRRNPTEIRAEAISCFKTELSILQDLTPTFGMARHVLRRLRALIASVKATVQELAPDPKAAQSLLASPTTVYMNQPLTAPPSGDHDHVAFDPSMLDKILGDVVLPETSLPHNDLTSIWPDDLLSYQWTLPTGVMY
ncbi:hypothetical protein BDW59DRAFT_148612 [Aspergillus cavernicola]|uniref:Zn(2)-C6 fungal-type domain-containing protein n=1 Tax=Aspergillus cavernicola TaxID=176166 RepID=A0ABR4I795_9EURO